MTDTKELVAEREKIYGHPLDNFRIIAQLWSSYLMGKRPIILLEESARYSHISYLDVGMMMILMKVGRISTGGIRPDQDSLDDIAGYIECINQCNQRIEEENERG